MNINDQMPRLLSNSLVVAVAVLGTIYCVTTAFDLSVMFFPLLVVTVLFALFFSACFLWKRVLLLLLPLGALVILMGVSTALFSSVGPSLQQLLHDILTRFSSAYPNLSFAIPPEPTDFFSRNYTFLFAILAVLLSVWMAWGVGYRSCLISVAGTLPFLLITVTINDTPPHALPLVLLVTCWVTVLLARERPEEPTSMDASRLLLTLMATLLVLGVIGVVYPKEDTRNRELPQMVQDILNKLPGPVQNVLSRESTGFLNEELGADTGETLDLTTQGTRERKDTVMLQVSSTEAGVLYLRGAAKDIYTGSSWESRNEATLTDSIYAHTSLGAAFGDTGQAAVEIRNLHDSATVAFTPYGFINCAGAEDIGSDLRIPCYEDDYIIYYWPGVGTMDLRQQGIRSLSYDSYVEETCLALPEDVGQELYDLALSYGYDPDLGTLETIAWVAEFVRTTGSYRLNVSRQPTNYDFAVYFLTESKAGYCVHFATATAVMLRALGIPARYASGYRAQVFEAGDVVDVTDMETHAWAEVYLTGLGWIPIESTPGFGESVSLPDVAHSPRAPEEAETEEGAGEEAAPTAPESEDGDAQSEPSPSAAPPSPQAGEAPPEPSAEPQPEPEAQAAQEEEQEAARTLWLLVFIPAALVLLVLVLIIRHSVILRRRARRFLDRDNNRAMIHQWAYLEELREWGAEIPDGMEALALKAKFSQHTITREELSGFSKVVIRTHRDTVKKLSRWQKLRFKWLSCLDLS